MSSGPCSTTEGSEQDELEAQALSRAQRWVSPSLSPLWSAGCQQKAGSRPQGNQKAREGNSEKCTHTPASQEWLALQGTGASLGVCLPSATVPCKVAIIFGGQLDRPWPQQLFHRIPEEGEAGDPQRPPPSACLRQFHNYTQQELGGASPEPAQHVCWQLKPRARYARVPEARHAVLPMLSVPPCHISLLV